MAPYSYRPLERRSEIRVLHLSPALEDYEPLCGTLVHVDLDSQPYYKTLSYTWGEPDFTCTIKLDVPGFLKELYNGYVSLYNDEGVRPGDHISNTTHDSYISIPKRDHPGWVAFRLFISRPWFRRVWVIQEFALPRLVTMVCGDWTMDATVPGMIMMLFNVIPISHVVADLDDPIVNELAHRGLILVQAHLRWRLRCGNKTGLATKIFDSPSATDTSIIAPTDRSLHNLVTMTSICDSSDPRDRFYGVLGLCTDLDDPGLEADYAKEVEEIELDVLKNIFKRGHGLRILESLWWSSRTTGPSPSWLRSWTKQPAYEFTCGIRARNNFRNRSTASYIQPIRLEDASNVVLIKGYVLDIVEELGMERSSDCPSETTVETVLRQIEAMIEGSLFLRNGHYPPDAWWRTVIGNKVDKGSLESAEYSTKYRNFRNILNDQVDNVETPYNDMQKLKDFDELMLSLARTDDARFCITRSGLMAMVPRYAKTGDAIITVFGDPNYQTFVVRKRANSDCHIWIGKAYIHCISGVEYRDIEEGEPCEIKIC
ncbi:hypothetical protein JMJ35_000429 [Cladonia borealis]|uniref:Heterokaryon incompatibility domain-containing protein n=1 Tax=Cladonia borealis TaxID=184061 RepID=A0AA39V7X2_9LECA|nr:hypothetical protein JMJ35_000429 [Cladonia borealis]